MPFVEVFTREKLSDEIRTKLAEELSNSCWLLRQTLSEYSFWKQSASHRSRLCSKTSRVWRSHS